jgi:8-oxo-dGTP diphosphatase
MAWVLLFAELVSGIPALNEIDKIKGIRFINSLEVVDFPRELSEIVPKIFEKIQSKSTLWK